MSEKKAKKGDTVRVHYEGRFENGELFDSSKLKGPDGSERGPLEFKLGEGKVIKGFENAIEGMGEGETKEVEIKPEDGYGDHDPTRVQEVPIEDLKKSGINPEVGMMLQLQHPAMPGVMLPVQITKVGEKTVTLDMNHPLAGKKLNFKIELVEIKE